MFTQNSSIESVNQLPVGRYAADFGFLVEQSVNPENVLIAAQALLNSKQEFVVASQAGLLVKAQQMGLAFEDWAPLKTI